MDTALRHRNEAGNAEPGTTGLLESEGSDQQAISLSTEIVVEPGLNDKRKATFRTFVAVRNFFRPDTYVSPDASKLLPSQTDYYNRDYQDIRVAVKRLNYMDALIDNYLGYIKIKSDTQVERYMSKTGSVDSDKGERAADLYLISRRIVGDKARQLLREVFDFLPDREREAIRQLAKPKNYAELLKAIGYGMDKRYKGRDFVERCNLVQDALVFQAFQRMGQI